MFKTCTRCGKKKKAEAGFYKQSRAKDGFSSWCKVCTAKYKKGWKGARPREDVGPGKKRCSRCEDVKSTRAFNKNASARDGRSSYCRDCNKAYWARYERAPSTAS